MHHEGCVAAGNDLALRTLDSRLSSCQESIPTTTTSSDFVVRRYAYDPARRERRHIVVAAFDNATEFKAAIDAFSSEVRTRRDSGEEVDPREHITGAVLEPGHERKQQSGRIIRHAVERGASLEDESWNRLATDLPPGMAIFRYESKPDPNG